MTNTHRRKDGALGHGHAREIKGETYVQQSALEPHHEARLWPVASLGAGRRVGRSVGRSLCRPGRRVAHEHPERPLGPASACPAGRDGVLDLGPLAGERPVELLLALEQLGVELRLGQREQRRERWQWRPASRAASDAESRRPADQPQLSIVSQRRPAPAGRRGWDEVRADFELLNGSPADGPPAASALRFSAACCCCCCC